jgi:hypothetical protein
MVLIALMAQAGFTGNFRYLAIAIALTSVIGAAGLVRLVRIARAHLSARAATVAAVVLVVVAVPFFATAASRTRDELRGGMHESTLNADLPNAIARAGGRAAVVRCGTVATAWYDTQAVARALHVHESRVTLTPAVPGTIFSRRGSIMGEDPRFPERTVTDRWVVASSCPPR